MDLLNEITENDIADLNEECQQLIELVGLDVFKYGHRTRGGNGFVPGKHMMELSIMELQKNLPSYLKEWLNDFLNSHEL